MHSLQLHPRLRALFAAGALALGLSSALAAPVVPDANALMDWAERSYPQHFPGRQPTQTLAPYLFRHYPSTGNYLGVAGSAVYVLGPAVGNVVQPQYVGELAAFACLVNPASCASEPDGANDCMDLTLTRAATYEARRRYLLSGGVTMDVVETRSPLQSALFRGRSVQSWRLVSETTGPGADDRGRTEDTQYFERVGERGIAFHGQVQEGSSVTGGRQTLTRIEHVWDPAWVDHSAALSPGQSFTAEVTGQTTYTTNGVTTGPTTATEKYRTRFVGYETRQTAAGSFPACRFESSSPDAPDSVSVIWVWRGWGIELERESTINTGAGGSFTDRWLLQRLSVNGQPAP